MCKPAPTALLADDEPLLLRALEKELAVVWPELVIVDRLGDGNSATTALLEGNHDVAFLDIHMPGDSGIDVLKSVVEEWPESNEAKPPPLFVFVTAHDDYAIQAFELAAIDYVIKPVTLERLQKSVERLKHNWHMRNTELSLSQLVEKVNNYSPENPQIQTNTQWLDSVRAGVGNTVHLIPVKDIIMFEASDKYVVVHTNSEQALIRESLRSLLPRLNPDQFKQIHRSTVVNLDHVKAAKKVEGRKLTLTLEGCELTPRVSRLYHHLFKAM